MSPLWMFPALLVAILTGFPVALTMLSLAVVFGLHSFGFEGLLHQCIQKIEETATAQVLAAVPLFIFMGAMFEQSGIANRLFDAIQMWIRRVPGGMAVGTIVMCVIFAATSGVVGATETVVGLLAIPPMLRYGYNKGLISGVICAGGALGTIIPPSVLAVVIGPTAQADVGRILLGMFIPGLMLAGSYIVYIVIRCTIRPRGWPARAARRRRADARPEAEADGRRARAADRRHHRRARLHDGRHRHADRGFGDRCARHRGAGHHLPTLLVGRAGRCDHAHRAHHGHDPDHRRLRSDVRRRLRRLGRPPDRAGVSARRRRRQVLAAVRGHDDRLHRRLHARAAGHHPDGGADRHAAHRQCRLRPGMVLRAVPGHAADRLPDAPDGALDLLPARHRAAGDQAAPHVHGHLAVHRACSCWWWRCSSPIPSSSRGCRASC